MIFISPLLSVNTLQKLQNFQNKSYISATFWSGFMPITYVVIGIILIFGPSVVWSWFCSPFLKILVIRQFFFALTGMTFLYNVQPESKHLRPNDSGCGTQWFGNGFALQKARLQTTFHSNCSDLIRSDFDCMSIKF